MDVIGAGLGRTGTASLQTALETLGYGPCYHWKTLLEHPWREAHWHAALDDMASNHTPRWGEIFQGFRAAVDWPTAAFWRELSEAFPDAKVILTARDPEDWYESFAQTISITIGATQPLPATRAAIAEHYGLTADVPRGSHLAHPVIAQHMFGGRPHDREHVLNVYRNHVRDVVDRLPAERLLVLDPAQGWAPLCDFLKVPVPELPYPHVNLRNDFWKLMSSPKNMPPVGT
ncbi:sulfotransferase family protein [Streptomyces sp. NPDC058629]|uniref:sulfotransferase family protein n=1 Tax=Streptomyces sp. NPDC058629 TaxID=3346565 RepID=UPI0036646A75